MKIHSGEKPNTTKPPLNQVIRGNFESAQWRKTIKCNQCDFASLWANALTKYMKMHNFDIETG